MKYQHFLFLLLSIKSSNILNENISNDIGKD